LTLASRRHLWSGPVARRPAGALLVTNLAADQKPLHFTAFLFYTAAIIAEENPAADPKTKARQLYRSPYDTRLYNLRPQYIFFML